MHDSEQNWRPGGDSNPRSVPTLERGDAENRSTFPLDRSGVDQTICSPAVFAIDQSGYTDLGNGLLSYIDALGREVWIRKVEPHVRGSLPTLTQEQIDRFWSRVDKSGGPDSCWPWTRGKTRGGYGFFKIGKRNYPAHRIAYALVKGMPPLSHDVDHEACDNPPCCNPAHLEAVTHQQNIARTVGRTICKYGHERPMSKPCPTCLSIRRRAHYALLRGDA